MVQAAVKLELDFIGAVVALMFSAAIVTNHKPALSLNPQLAPASLAEVEISTFKSLKFLIRKHIRMPTMGAEEF